jgi:hypothetical protein
VGKVHNELINDTVYTDRPADGRKPKIWRINADEVVLVEALEFVVADARRSWSECD